MSAERVANEHYRDRRRLSEAVAGLARQLWDRLSADDLDGSWARLLPQLTVGVAGAQLAAARQADSYTDDVLEEQDVDPEATGQVVPSALAGIASDGRPLDSLLLNPVTVVKVGLAAGAPMPQALAAGYANLDMLVRTQLADAGRAADQVAIAARPAVTGYVRMLVGKSCSRCVVLAGRRYGWNQGFPRHPRCDCIHVPAADYSADEIRTDPRRYFDSLSPAAQDEAFTKAGAEAIRAGADIGQVVNARRGMQTATVYGREVQVTTEGTTLRGSFGRARREGPLARRAGQRVRSTTQVRLMPEQILLEADGDRDEAVRLLRVHGYLTETAPRQAQVSAPTTIRIPAAQPQPVAAVVPDPELIAVPEPDVAAPDATEALEFGIASGIRESRRLSGGAVGDVRLVTFNDGTQAIHKTAHQQFAGYSPKDLTDHEDLVAQIGKAIGAPIPAVVRTGDAEVFMEYVADAKPASEALRKYRVKDRPAKIAEFVGSPAGRLLGILDLLVANGDRHEGNWLVRPDGSIVGIDHGIAWPEGQIKESHRRFAPSFDSPFAERFNTGMNGRESNWKPNDLSPADVAWIGSQLRSLQPEFDRLGRGSWLDYTLFRLRQMAEWAGGDEDVVKP